MNPQRGFIMDSRWIASTGWIAFRKIFHMNTGNEYPHMNIRSQQRKQEDAAGSKRANMLQDRVWKTKMNKSLLNMMMNETEKARMN